MLGILHVNNKKVTPLKPLTKEDIEKLLSSGIVTSGRMGGKEMATRVLGEMYLYKCIEEELGIDLVTLFKALKNGVYYDAGNKTIKYYQVNGTQYLDIDIESQYLNLMYANPYEDGCHYEMGFRLTDYGKTWALTKEELEISRRRER